MCSVLPRTYYHSKQYSQLAKLTYTTSYQLADFYAECLIETQKNKNEGRGKTSYRVPKNLIHKQNESSKSSQ